MTMTQTALNTTSSGVLRLGSSNAAAKASSATSGTKNQSVSGKKKEKQKAEEQVHEEEDEEQEEEELEDEPAGNKKKRAVNRPLLSEVSMRRSANLLGIRQLSRQTIGAIKKKPRQGLYVLAARAIMDVNFINKKISEANKAKSRAQTIQITKEDLMELF